MNRPQRAALRMLLAPSLLLAASTNPACSSAAEHSDHSPAPLVDSDAADDSEAAPAVAADGTDGTAEAAACAPACAQTEVCCTDAHGHFPTCRAGGSCP